MSGGGGGGGGGRGWGEEGRGSLTIDSVLFRTAHQTKSQVDASFNGVLVTPFGQDLRAHHLSHSDCTKQSLNALVSLFDHRCKFVRKFN